MTRTCGSEVGITNSRRGLPGGSVRRGMHVRVLSLILATAALALALASTTIAASERFPVGSGLPTDPPAAHGPPAKSSPPDRTKYNRQAISADRGPAKGALPVGYTIVDPVIANTNSSLASTDTFGDSEPSLSVNASNTNQLAIYAFSERWGSGNAPIWYSTNGGTTWTKYFTFPAPAGVAESTGCPCDVTLDHDRGSNLYATVLDQNATANPGDVYTGDTTNPTSSAAWQWFAPGGITQKTDTFNAGNNDADQPWVRIVRDPTVATQDNVYVGYDDFTSPLRIRVAVATGTRPPNFVRNNSPGLATCCVNPGTRLAVDHRNGRVYVVWQYWDTVSANDGDPATKPLWYVMSRSTDGGSTWSLNGFTGGQIIAKADSDQPTPKFGTVNALLGGITSVGVDPNNGDVYYVYGTKDSSTGKNRLAIRRITDNGVGGMTIGAENFVTGQVQAALPAVAVATNGAVGVLYHTYDGVDPTGFPKFAAHFAQSTNQGATWGDTSLVTFLSPSTDNANDRQRVLGDYQSLRRVGTTFYGTFPANGAAFGRSLSNIDPVYFSAPAAGTQTSYPRPIGAAKIRVTLVPAFEACTSANRTHGGGFNRPSCNPPIPSSSFLTVPADDSTKAAGSIVFKVRLDDSSTPADESNITLTASLSDVRLRSNLVDYAGELQAEMNLKITDRFNGTGLNEQATVQEFPFRLTLPCATTPTDNTIGSTCSTSTTINSVVPGAVRNGSRAIHKLGEVKIYDGGGDGDVDTPGNTLFAEQGVFVP